MLHFESNEHHGISGTRLRAKVLPLLNQESTQYKEWASVVGLSRRIWDPQRKASRGMAANNMVMILLYGLCTLILLNI